MATKIPRVIADLELQLATAVAIGGTSFTLSSANDDDGNALPAGVYVFTVDAGTSNKEYLLGQLNGTAVTSVYNVTRQGTQTSGAVRAHRVGSPVVLTNFAALQLVADTLRGAVDLDGANPLSYDTAPTLSDGKELATVQYVLDTVSGGTVAFDAQTITGNAGEAVAAGNLVYFKTSDQEWYLTDADTAATIEGVQLGIALGTGSDGAGITGGIQIAGTWTTTGLTAGALYYASNTAGAISTSAGTTSKIVGLALSTTKLLIIPSNPQTLKDSVKDALVGAGATPSSSNKFLTEDDINTTFFPTPQVVVFTSSGTWTKDAGLKYIIVEGVGGGGGNDTDSEQGGGGGGYFRKLILAAALGATETVTIGAGGNAASTPTNGGNTTFGAHCTGNGGVAGGAGGTATGGDINIQGQDSEAGSSGTGGNYSLGGSTPLGLGGTGDSPGTGYGSGGGSGENGQPGIVIVTEHYS